MNLIHLIVDKCYKWDTQNPAVRKVFTEEPAGLSSEDEQDFLRERRTVQVLEWQETTEQRLSMQDTPHPGDSR